MTATKKRRPEAADFWRGTLTTMRPPVLDCRGWQKENLGLYDEYGRTRSRRPSFTTRSSTGTVHAGAPHSRRCFEPLCRPLAQVQL